MKILNLRFKNLNSLYGEWVIDFTNPAYLDNGIFALTGPTGAGKTTILDAICLALYGATPRLGRITKSNNEIMSQQMGECFAEVTFESQAGKYICHWSQRRARKSADGKLQDQEHQIADVDSGKLIETKKSRVLSVIEDKTGMDFDRFTRSILLAQGGFDSFLKADTEQKSKILEQLTGTEIYTEISLKVHERQRSEQQNLQVLEADIIGVPLLSCEEENNINQAIQEKNHLYHQLKIQLTAAQKAINWLTNIEQLNSQIHQLSTQLVTHQEKIDAFAPQQQKLDLAKNAEPLTGDYVILCSLRKEQQTAQIELDEINKSLPNLASQTQLLEKQYTEQQLTCLQAKQNLKNITPLLKQVRRLDLQLNDQKEKITQITQAFEHAKDKTQNYKNALVEQQNIYQQAQHKQAQVTQYLTEHAVNAALANEFTGIEQQISQLVQLQTNKQKISSSITQTQNTLSKANNNLIKKNQSCDTHKETTFQANALIEHTENQLRELLAGKLLREYRADKESLLRQIALVRKIEQLEEMRHGLEDGKACPLCGSLTHPYAQGNIPQTDELELSITHLTSLITNAEQFEENIKELQSEQVKLNSQLVTAEREQQEIINQQQQLAATLTDLTQQQSETNQQIDNLVAKLNDKLTLLSLTVTQETNLPSLLTELTQRNERYQTQLKQQDSIKQQLTNITTEINRLQVLIDTQQSRISELEQELAQAQQSNLTSKAERTELFGNKNPDIEETVLTEKVEQQEKLEASTREDYNKLQQALSNAQTQRASLQKRITERQTELSKAEQDFSQALPNIGLTLEEEFIRAKLPLEEQTRLADISKKLFQEKTALTSLIDDKQHTLDELVKEKLTDEPLTTLTEVLNELQNKNDSLSQELAQLNHQITQHKLGLETVKEKQKLINKQQQECQGWNKLHELIGSADGKKFRNFAQGLTFELMVSHANQQLQKMSDRYLLIRDTQLPLELNVIDNYQACETRSTSNLSGGESFIISLALALGLAKMSSQKVRVDSLFLDEGFGTLDQDSLDTALTTLSSLHEEGKLIGIISHVSALKERIATQLQISPISSGRSKIIGPGCQQL